MNPFFQRFAKDNFLIVVGQVLNFIKPLVLTPLILKTAPIEVFGTYVLAQSMAGFVAGFAPMGVDFYCKRNLPSAETRVRKRELFYPQLVLIAIFVSICGVILLSLDNLIKASFFKGAPNFSMTLVVLFMLCYMAYGQLSDYFRYTNRMRIYMAAGVSYPYLFIIAVVAARIFGASFTVDNLLLAEIATLALIIIFLEVKIILDIGIAFPKIVWREMADSVRLGFPLLMVSINEFFLFSGARYIIAAFLDVKSVACFVAATQLGNLTLFLPRALGVALPPLLCHAADSKHNREFDSMLHYSLKGHLLVSIPYVFFCLLAGKELLEIFSNSSVAMEAWGLVPLIAFANVIYGISLIISKVFIVKQKTKVLSNSSLVAVVASLAINLIFIAYLKSIFVAAIAIIISYAVMLKIILDSDVFCRAAIDLRLGARISIVSLFAVLPAWIISHVLHISSTTTGVLLIFSLASYIVLVITQDIVSKKESDFFCKLFKAKN